LCDSIITWRHINFHGEYDFSEEKLKDSVGFDLPEILSWKLDAKRERNIPVKSINVRIAENPMKHFYLL
jgi:hypothetical protein